MFRCQARSRSEEMRKNSKGFFSISAALVFSVAEGTWYVATLTTMKHT